MRILWICGAHVLGGAERVSLQLSTLLRARNHTIDVLCRSDSPVYRASAGIGLTTHPALPGGALNVRAIAAIRRAVDMTSPDIALVTTADEWVWSCLARRRTDRTCLVLVRHMVVRLNARVRWLADHRADAVVAVSDAVRRSLLGHLGVRPEHIHVIHNPVRFSPRTAVPEVQDRTRARSALGLPLNARWVGFFSGLQGNKGIRDVMFAVSRANEQLGDTRLLVGGRSADERNRQSLTELAKNLGIEDRVHYFGDIEGMEDALTAVNVVVLATHSKLSEALPATLLEAMACGTPVLGYASGGIAEAIGADETAGRLARADDVDDLSRHLVELLGDETGAERMALAALARVRSLADPQQATDRYEQLFAAVCAGRPLATVS